MSLSFLVVSSFLFIFQHAGQRFCMFYPGSWYNWPKPSLPHAQAQPIIMIRTWEHVIPTYHHHLVTQQAEPAICRNHSNTRVVRPLYQGQVETLKTASFGHLGLIINFHPIIFTWNETSFLCLVFTWTRARM